MLDFYGSFYREVYDHGGCPVHDAVAVAHVIRPELLETVARHVAVELGSGLCRGRTVVDTRRRRVAPEPTALVAVDVDVDGFRELLLTRLGSLAAGQLPERASV